MKGKYFIELKLKGRDYKMFLDRQFTIILGDSATGKSYFVDTLRELIRDGKYFGRKYIKSDLNNFYFPEISTSDKYEEFLIQELKELRGSSLVVMDEDTVLRYSYCLERVCSVDAYFLFVCRKPLKMLPYSIFSIYTFDNIIKSEDGLVYKTVNMNLYYNEDFSTIPDVLLVEDSGSGLDFFSSCLRINVLTAKGNSNIRTKLLELSKSGKYSNIGVVVDSAAFGGYIESCVTLANIVSTNINFYVPESFEWLILRTRLCNSIPEIGKLLNKPYEYCETTKYKSYERMFTDYLIHALKEKGIVYSKSKCNRKLLTKLLTVSDEVLNMLCIDKNIIK